MRAQTFKSWMLLPVIAVGFVSPAVQAQGSSLQGGTFRVNAGIAPTSYQISFDANAPATAGHRNRKAKADYVAANAGFSWVSPQRIYVDFSLQQSLSASHDLWKDATLAGGAPAPDRSEQDFSHDAWALTAGYIHVLSQGQTVSGFGGYRQAKTTLAAPNGATVPTPGGPSATATLAFSKDIFDSQGIFFGAAWGMPALAGSISVSGAVAFLGGKWSDGASYNNDADATVGFSFNAGYTYRFAQAWAVTADYRLQAYSYGFKQSTTGTTTNPAYTVTENISSLGARVSYQF